MEFQTRYEGKQQEDGDSIQIDQCVYGRHLDLEKMGDGWKPVLDKELM